MGNRFEAITEKCIMPMQKQFIDDFSCESSKLIDIDPLIYDLNFFAFDDDLKKKGYVSGWRVEGHIRNAIFATISSIPIERRVVLTIVNEKVVLIKSDL
jgi:hypothetical protein